MADQYVNVNGIWRKAEPKFVVVDGINRAVKDTYEVTNGVIRKCWNSYSPPNTKVRLLFANYNSYSALNGSFTPNPSWSSLKGCYYYCDADASYSFSADAITLAYDNGYRNMNVKIDQYNYRGAESSPHALGMAIKVRLVDAAIGGYVIFNKPESTSFTSWGSAQTDNTISIHRGYKIDLILHMERIWNSETSWSPQPIYQTGQLYVDAEIKFTK